MVVVHVPAIVKLPVVAASTHALVDAGALAGNGSATFTLWPYAAAAIVPLHVPAARTLASASCVVASIAHFGADVGIARSVAIHTAWVCAACCGCAAVAWAHFAWFYTCVHAASHIRWRLGIAWALAVAPLSLRVTERMQLIIVAHAVVAHRRSRRQPWR